MACVWGTLDGAALVWLLIAAVMLACVAIDLVALVRQARGDDPALMDLTFTANEGPGAPVAVSRAVKWLFLYPCFIGPCLFVLRHAPAPACA
jgi:hypothetical protein